MSAVRTNRDLYRAVQALNERHAASSRSLEAYLSALYGIVSTRCRHREDVSADELLAMLEDSWTAPVPPLDEGWRTLPDTGETTAEFAGWRDVILRQIRDLREMEEAGTLMDGQRSFGMDAPRGDRWFNFTPADYLEAAVAGTFGGWSTDDAPQWEVGGPGGDTGEDGTIPRPAPSPAADPVERIPDIPWTVFIDFLERGQLYE